MLASIDERLHQLLDRAEFSSDATSIRNAAFATWDSERNTWTTTRGPKDSWHKFDYRNWNDVISAVKQISLPENALGWLFFNTDGPYYKITFSGFLQHVDCISTYVESIGNYDFGWVGADHDIGVIIEFEHTSFCKNDFCLSTWAA